MVTSTITSPVRITAIQLLVCAVFATCTAPFSQSQAQSAPEYHNFEGKQPTLQDLERVFGLDVESRAIYSVQGGFRFDAPAEAAAAPAPAPPSPTAPPPPASSASTKPTKTIKPATVSVQQKAPAEPQATGHANTESDAPSKQKPDAAAPQPTSSQRADIKSTPVPSIWVTEQIHFNDGSDRLVSSEAGIVDRVGEMMIAHPYVRVIISGHANATGSAVANDKISKRRAMAVRKYLWRAFAIPEDRFELRWMGSREALPNKAPADPANRRVQFGVLRPG